MMFQSSTNVGAVAATISPWWLPHLHTISEGAAELLPIMGVCWLVVQIVSKLYTTYHTPKDNDENDE